MQIFSDKIQKPRNRKPRNGKPRKTREYCNIPSFGNNLGPYFPLLLILHMLYYLLPQEKEESEGSSPWLTRRAPLPP